MLAVELYGNVDVVMKIHWLQREGLEHSCGKLRGKPCNHVDMAVRQMFLVRVALATQTVLLGQGSLSFGDKLEIELP